MLSPSTKKRARRQGTIRLDLITTPPGKPHDRQSFDCGKQSLNQSPASLRRAGHPAACQPGICASPSDTPQQVVGRYSLGAGSLRPPTGRRHSDADQPNARPGKAAVTRSCQ
jgi:hypothetical protein